MACGQDCSARDAAVAEAEAVLADAQAAEQEAQQALDSINETLKDAEAKEAKRQEMSQKCKETREQIEAIGNTVKAPANWEEFKDCEKCINETYADALADFITQAKSEKEACEQALRDATAAREAAETALSQAQAIPCVDIPCEDTSGKY